MHVHSVDRFGCLAALTSVLKQTGLAVNRAKVKTFAVNQSSGHTFYVMDSSGDAPDRRKVEQACQPAGTLLRLARRHGLHPLGSIASASAF